MDSQQGDFGTAHENALVALVLAWGRRWKLIFNLAKWMSLLINRLRREPLQDLHLDGVPLECIFNLRYLGVWLNLKLCWQEYIA